MQYSREDFETLRLLRAFGKIQDPEKRRAIIEMVEIKADSSNEGSDDERSIPPGLIGIRFLERYWRVSDHRGDAGGRRSELDLLGDI